MIMIMMGLNAGVRLTLALGTRSPRSSMLTRALG